ncbi:MULTISPECIES: hypothetical protein [Frankia]|uniref:hypothetical protein n=1 Tax=Frankia TaxID=1854 RepID=UPI0002F4C479|nr:MULTISPECIES: hypothetical protein [Frankia]
MTAPEPQEPLVSFISLVACNKCRRRRGAQFVRSGSVEPVPVRGTCPHGKPLRVLWAPGQGPGSAPPDDQPPEDRSPGPPSPGERRQGPV